MAYYSQKVGRKQVYASDAEKQRAYRARKCYQRLLKIQKDGLWVKRYIQRVYPKYYPFIKDLDERYETPAVNS